MILSTSQLVGLGTVAAIIALAFLFLWYVIPRINPTFRSSVKTAVYWSLGLLVIQTALILVAGAD